jgi:hypothetical protein
MRKKYPICYNPFNECRDQPCDDVHHIIPLIKDPKQAYNKRNLVTLCRACHYAVEKIERKYGETSFIFNTSTQAIRAMGVQKSLENTHAKTIDAVMKKERYIGGVGCQKGCYDTYKDRWKASGSIWCLRMKDFTRAYCGSCEKNRNKINEQKHYEKNRKTS